MLKNSYIVKDDVIYMDLFNKKGEHKVCKIDKSNYDKLLISNLKWHLIWNNSVNGYYVKSTKYHGIINGKATYETIYMHRFLTDCPKNMTIDHLNYNTLDNRLENLKIVTILENNRNRQDKANNNSTTGIRNVSYSSRDGKFLVQFQVKGINTCMGKFNTLDEAREFADSNRHKYYTNITK